MTRLFALTALLLMVPAGVLAAAPAPVPASVVVIGRERAGDSVIYRLRIVESERPVMAILPDNVPLATLEVDGVVRQRIGTAVPDGSPPLGYQSFTLTLANLQPTDRVGIRVQGSAAAPRFIDDADAVSFAHYVGVGSGAYYAILFVLALFQLVAFCILRDPAIAWYFGFTVAMFGLEVARDGVFTSGTNPGLIVAFRALFTICLVGFSASFLHLRSQAPRLLVAAIVANSVPTLVLVAVAAAMHRTVPIIGFISADSVGMGALIVIAALRHRSGYVPAAYLAFGLVGIPAMGVVAIVAALGSVVLPAFLSRWALEIGAAFDVLTFSLAVMLRVRYSLRRHAQTQRALELATIAACHDELTGLLNRRGLEARLEELTAISSTVLFVDLDGFKAVNDAGGHAAGDDALKTVAGILRAAVRSTDAVARVGGDEFIVVLAGCTDPTEVAVVRARITLEVSFVRPLGTDHPTCFGVSIGAAQTEPGKPFSTAIAGADADAYRAKARHRAKASEPAVQLTNSRES